MLFIKKKLAIFEFECGNILKRNEDFLYTNYII